MANPKESSSDLSKDPTVLVWGQNPYWAPAYDTYHEPAPTNWGTPWEHIHPSIQFEGELIRRTPDDSHRWFRAQAARYLMRYPSPRLCRLTNRARHAAFGRQAAEAVAEAVLAAGMTEVCPRAAQGKDTSLFEEPWVTWLLEERSNVAHSHETPTVKLERIEMIAVAFSSSPDVLMPFWRCLAWGAVGGACGGPAATCHNGRRGRCEAGVV